MTRRLTKGEMVNFLKSEGAKLTRIALRHPNRSKAQAKMGRPRQKPRPS